MITVRKTQQSEAIQINSPEEEEIVRGWLSGMGIVDRAGLEELRAQKFWFLRDHGSEIVYVVSAEDFALNYETVPEDQIIGTPIASVSVSTILPEFRFDS